MPSDGLKALRRAAADGDPTAAAFTAVLAALGTDEPQDWTIALERLGRAAALGSQAARGQLRALAPRATGGWAQIAGSIDLSAWLQPAPVRRIHARLADVRGFLSPEVCAWLIARAQGRLSRAEIFDPTQAGAIEDPTRTNSTAVFGLADLDLVMLLVCEKIAATVGVGLETLEPCQVLHYAVGQSFAPHFDFLAPDAPGLALEIARAGQRKATVLVYLNADYEGGATDFPVLGLAYRGRTGDALLFANLDEAGQPATDMLHAGLPPTAGEKWLFSQWIRER